MFRTFGASSRRFIFFVGEGIVFGARPEDPIPSIHHIIRRRRTLAIPRCVDLAELVFDALPGASFDASPELTLFSRNGHQAFFFNLRATSLNSRC